MFQIMKFLWLAGKLNYNDSNCLVSSSFMLGIVLRVLHVLSHLIFPKTLEVVTIMLFFIQSTLEMQQECDLGMLLGS